jgi:hypothetical protein
MTECYVRIVTDSLLRNYTAAELIRFDCVPTRVLASSCTLGELVTQLAYDHATTADKVRLWRFERRTNDSYRPIIPIQAQYLNATLANMFPAFVNSGKFVDLYMEMREDLPVITADDVILFVKLYQPERYSSRVIGSIIVNKNRVIETLFPELCYLAQLKTSDLQIVEELRSYTAHLVNVKHTVSQSGLIRGDILVIQRVNEASVLDHLQELSQRVNVHLHSLECPPLEVGTIELNRNMTHSQALEEIAKMLNVHASHLKLTGEKNGPRYKPYRVGKVASLKDMIETKNRLYISLSKKSMIAGLENEIAYLRSILSSHGITVDSECGY